MSDQQRPAGAMVRTARDKQATIKDLFDKAKPQIAAVLPKHLAPDRLLKVALSATARTPALLACTPHSLLLCVMQASELGLEVGGLLGDAYFVPFKDTAQLIIGYRGMIKLARQSGQIQSIEAHVVRKNDTFEIEFGLVPKLIHKPNMTAEPGDPVAVYAIAKFKDGALQCEVLSIHEVNLIRARSAAADSGPWVTDYAEMAKKTVVRRLCKFLPLSPELAKAMEHEEAIEQNVASPIIDVEVLSAMGDASTQVEQSRADAMKEKLTEKANGAAPSEQAT